MQVEEDPFQFMMENSRLAPDLHTLGDISVIELRKCVIIVVGLSADYAAEVRVLDNNPTGLERTKVEYGVGKQCSRLLSQQQDSKALSASKSTITADRSGKNGRPCYRFKGNCFNCGRKDHRTEGCRSAKNQEMPPTTRRAEVGASATFMRERSTLRINTVACADTLSTGLAIVRSKELRRVRCWSK